MGENTKWQQNEQNLPIHFIKYTDSKQKLEIMARKPHIRPIKKLFEEKRHLKQYFIMAALYFSSESKLNY